DPSAAERFHRSPEGHRAGRSDRPCGIAPALYHRGERRVQLHAAAGGGVLLRADHDPAGTADRLVDRAGPRKAAGRGADVSTPALECQGVAKSFGKLEVLKGVDLTVDEHEVICLIGASGSGKSTLLRCINLLER